MFDTISIVVTSVNITKKTSQACSRHRDDRSKSLPVDKFISVNRVYRYKRPHLENLMSLLFRWMKTPGQAGISGHHGPSLSLRCHAHGPLAKRLMHMVHLSRNTSRESKSSSDWLDYTGFLGDVRSLTLCLETKLPWCQTPSRKKKAVVFRTVRTDAYHDQLNAGVSKVCEIFKVRGIESFKYIREFHTPVCYCGDISMPRNVTLNKMNCDWLFDMSVKRPHGRALTNDGCPLFQTFSRQSEGLAMWDYHDPYFPEGQGKPLPLESKNEQ